MNKLPKGWLRTTLGEVGAWSSGGTPQSGNKDFYGGDIPWIRSGDLPEGPILTHEIGITKQGLDNSSAKWVPENVVLVAMYGATIGKMGLTTYPVTTNQAIATCLPNEAVLPEFLFWGITEMKDSLINLGKGGAQPNISQKVLKSVPFQLPPLAEQKRIITKINDLTTRTANTHVDLDCILELITKYKQRLFSRAFSGQLIGEKPVKATKPNPQCWAIPKHWSWVSFEDVAEVASNLVSPDTIPDLPHIAPNNIESGTARLLPYRTISEDGMISAKNRFYPGQVLYSKIRPYLQKAILVDFDGACSADMYPINAREQLVPKFLLYWLISDEFAKFSSQHEGRTVLPKINQKELNGTPFPLPPIQEQNKIVQRIEIANEWLCRLTNARTAASELLPKLDAAILSKSFSLS